MLFWYQWRNVVAVANMAERVDGLISLKCGACYIILVRHVGIFIMQVFHNQALSVQFLAYSVTVS